MGAVLFSVFIPNPRNFGLFPIDALSDHIYKNTTAFFLIKLSFLKVVFI